MFRLTLTILGAAMFAACSAEEHPRPVRSAPGPGAGTPARPQTPQPPQPPPADRVEPAAASSRGTYLIVHASKLQTAAKRWAEYRREDGWSVSLLSVAAEDAVAEDGPRVLRDRIVERYETHRVDAGDDATFMTLMLGDAGPEGLPVWSYAQKDPSLIDRRDPRYVSDHPYQRMDTDDDLPDIPLGRVPARTVREALDLLEKVRRYDRGAVPGPWRRHVRFVAGEGHFGGVDFLLETMFRGMIERMVPEAFDVTVVYAKPTSLYCPTPHALAGTVLDQLAGGSLLFNYVGHGSEHGFDSLEYDGRRWPILESESLADLPDDQARTPVALLTACSAGWFDLPYDRQSIGESMLFHAGGPIAVIAGSRPTHPYANTVLQKDIIEQLLVERAETVGELDLAATRSMLVLDEVDREIDALARPLAVAGRWHTSLNLRRMHVRLYNLLGDPATRIAYPVLPIDDLVLDGETLVGSIPRLVNGTAVITIETAHASMARPHAMRPVVGRDDPEFPDKASHNFPLANDRVLRRLEAQVRDGWLEVDVGTLPEAAAVIKVYAQGWDDLDRPADAFGALGVRPRG